MRVSLLGDDCDDGDDGDDGPTARVRLQGESLVAPELIDFEEVSVFRRQVAAGSMTPDRAELAIRCVVELVG